MRVVCTVVDAGTIKIATDTILYMHTHNDNHNNRKPHPNALQDGCSKCNKA